MTRKPVPWSRVLGAMLFVVAALAVVQSYRTSAAQRRESDERQRFVACQAKYNEINNQRTRFLTESAEKERAAQRRKEKAEANLWLNPKIRSRPGQAVDPSVLAAFGEMQAAYTNWLIVIAEVDRERQAHPVPPAPSELCGQPSR